MRVLAIGDIHGCSQALDVLLRAVDPQPDDLIITLGDYVDRGPDSRGVIDRLLTLRQSHHLVPLLGNHDQMMLEAREQEVEETDWFCWCGGEETVASYPAVEGGGRLAGVPDAHWEFLERSCVDWFETDAHFFVHANVFPDLPLAEQPTYMLLWEKLDHPRPHVSGKVMVCGHTAQRSGRPLNLGHAVCIDTWVYGEGWLTCLDVTSGQIWQANQRGQERTARLDDFGPANV